MKKFAIAFILVARHIHC